MRALIGKSFLKAVILAAGILPLMVQPVMAERLKDLASLQGVRNNQLLGYGIVVGLDGTGDQTTQTPFTTQAMGNMLSQMGINLTPDQATKLQLKNVAAVMVTANLAAFARPGQAIDVTISSIGNAKSLRGGTLLMTQLKGGDGQVYAIAQGNVMVGGVGAGAGGANVTVNHLSAGRIPSGATVERAVPTAVGQGDYLFYELTESDFGTVSNAVAAINMAMGPGTAQAIDGRRIALRAPASPDDRVSFLGKVENIEIRASVRQAKVVVNPRTGSVVMNQRVALLPCAVAHGNLSVIVDAGQPGGGGADVQVNQDNGALVNVRAGANLADVVKALNSLGANPMDLLAILQAMKAAGALRAELEVI